jgi:hypothetical protein
MNLVTDRKHKEFQYIKVTDGQGIYKWTDYNGDGIQQLDEFEIAEYSDLQNISGFTPIRSDIFRPIKINYSWHYLSILPLFLIQKMLS